MAAPADIGAVFAAHRHGLVRLAVLLVGDVSTAEDVVQDAFLGTQRRADRLREPSAVLPYARTAVVNGCRSVLRRRAVARLRGASHEPPVWSAESAAMFGEDRREVIDALERLPARRREALVLRYYLDLTDAEIAATMGITEASVRSTIARALRAMSELLGEES